jgi:hypothetical protein
LNRLYLAENEFEVNVSCIGLQLAILRVQMNILKEIRSDTEHDIFILDRGLLGSIPFMVQASEDFMMKPAIAGELTRLCKEIYKFWLKSLTGYRLSFVFLSCDPAISMFRYKERQGASLGCDTKIYTRFGERIEHTITDTKLLKLKHRENNLEELYSKKSGWFGKTYISIATDFHSTNELVTYILEKLDIRYD